jgi:hypothetical protein
MAAGDRTETRVFGPTEVSTSAGSATVGTVPANRVWVTKQFIFTNTNGVDAWITVSVGDVTTASNAIFYQLPVAGNDTVVFDTALVMTATETVQAISDRSGVNITGVGWVKEV